MSRIMTHCGERIRLHRRNKNLTISQLAEKINKGKSTVSKYEQGLITIDIDTLFDVANALNITIYQLLDYENVHDQLEARRRMQMLPADNGKLFLYYYDGRNKKLTRGALVIEQIGTDDISNDITLYLDCKDLTQYHDCNFLGNGKVERYSSLIRYIITNQSNPIDQIIINILDPLSNARDFVGHLTALSNNPFTPISLKCILSLHPLKEDAELEARLILNKNDFRNMRRMNMFTPYHFY